MIICDFSARALFLNSRKLFLTGQNIGVPPKILAKIMKKYGIDSSRYSTFDFDCFEQFLQADQPEIDVARSRLS